MPVIQSFNVLSGHMVSGEPPEEVHCFELLPMYLLWATILANRAMYHYAVPVGLFMS